MRLKLDLCIEVRRLVEESGKIYLDNVVASVWNPEIIYKITQTPVITSVPFERSGADNSFGGFDGSTQWSTRSFIKLDFEPQLNIYKRGVAARLTGKKVEKVPPEERLFQNSMYFQCDSPSEAEKWAREINRVNNYENTTPAAPAFRPAGIQKPDWIDTTIMDVHGLNTYLGPKYRVFNLRWGSNDYYENNWKFNSLLRTTAIASFEGDKANQGLAKTFGKLYYGLEDFIKYMKEFVRITCTKSEIEVKNIISALLLKMYRHFELIEQRFKNESPGTFEACMRELFKFVHAFTTQTSPTPGKLFDPYDSNRQQPKDYVPTPELPNNESKPVIRKIWGKTITVVAESNGAISGLYVGSVNKSTFSTKLKPERLAGPLGIKVDDMITSINGDPVKLSDMATAQARASEINDMIKDDSIYMGFYQVEFTNQEMEDAVCNGLVIDNSGIHLARRIVHALDADREEVKYTNGCRKARRIREGEPGKDADLKALDLFKGSLVSIQ